MLMACEAWRDRLLPSDVRRPLRTPLAGQDYRNKCDLTGCRGEPLCDHRDRCTLTQPRVYCLCLAMTRSQVKLPRVGPVRAPSAGTKDRHIEMDFGVDEPS